MYVIDSLVLSAVHNGNAAVKETCQNVLKYYTIYSCGNSVIILTLSAIHHLEGTFCQLLFSKYTSPAIHKRPKVSSDPETKVLLDETEKEEEFIPPVIHASKKGAFMK